MSDVKSEALHFGKGNVTVHVIKTILFYFILITLFFLFYIKNVVLDSIYIF